MSDIQILLQKLADIAIRRKEKEEKAFRRGERFNVFHVLGLESNETRLHSALLAEILNPKGSHGLGNEPLRLFMNDVCNNAMPDFDVDNVRVNIEFDVGRINEDYTEGGRIDILVTDGVRMIVIENKIYAADQQNQLLRYNNFCGNKPHLLLYLTLDGHDASDISAGKISVDYQPISYKDDIIKWLEDCRIKAKECHSFREILSQYINTLKQLTNQRMESEDKEEVLKLMDDNLDATLEIINHLEAFTEPMIRKYLVEKLAEWAETVGLTFTHKESFYKGVRYGNISFAKADWKRKIGFSFAFPGYRGLYYGVLNPEEGPIGQCIPGFRNVQPWWPYGIRDVERYKNITPYIFGDLRNGKVSEHIERLCLNLLDFLDNHKKDYPMA
jgi:hypothetical protein